MSLAGSGRCLGTTIACRFCRPAIVLAGSAPLSLAICGSYTQLKMWTFASRVNVSMATVGGERGRGRGEGGGSLSTWRQAAAR
jgi:hypothetical protein